jgi:hypothetical protein
LTCWRRDDPGCREDLRLLRAHTRQKPKRKPLPAEWPRVYIELAPPEVEREGLDAFTIIGSETRAVLERRPASCVVVEVVRKKLVRKAEKNSLNTEVLIAEPLTLPIDKGVAGPGSQDGAIANTVCDLNDIEPWSYLRDLFYLLPDWPKNRVLELAPAYWKQTLQQDDAQQRLETVHSRRQVPFVGHCVEYASPGSMIRKSIVCAQYVSIGIVTIPSLDESQLPLVS